jgi:hypothetical protein
MSTATEHRSVMRNRWFMPAFCLFLGALMFGAFAIGGDTGQGAISLGIMAVLGAVFAFGAGRSETLSGLGGTGRDERWQMIDVHATALSGLVLVVAVIGGFLYEVADGQDGSPYAQLGAIGGVAYVLAVAVLRWRS